MTLLRDNSASINIANNLMQYDQTKHIKLDKNYIKDNLEVGVIKITLPQEC